MLTDSSAVGEHRDDLPRPRRTAGRTTRPADDPTPLNGAVVDVGARIGWLTRTARQLRGGEALRRLEDISSASGFGQSRVHRVEVGSQRHCEVVAAYERLLDLPAWSLRAAVDLSCRMHPSAAPRELGGSGTPLGVLEMSAMTDQVLDPGLELTGPDWVAWTRALTAVGGSGLPLRLAREAVGRLTDELGRSSGPGSVARWDAMAELRSGPYAAVVVEVARSWVADPVSPGLDAVTRAVGSTPSADAAVWMLGLLEGDRDRVVAAGAVGLEAMAGADPRTWVKLLPHLVQSLDRSEEGTARHAWTAHLLRLTPPEAWSAHGARPLRRIQPPASGAGRWDHRGGPRWAECRVVAGAVTARLGLDSEAMITRLVHDLAVGARETRAAATAALLTALPEVARSVAEQVAAMAARQEDAVLRARLLRRLPLVACVGVPASVRSWTSDTAPAATDRRRCALTSAAGAGETLPAELLDAACDAPALRGAALTAAGMVGHDVLDEWRDDVRPDVAEAARWWLRHGPRVAA